MDDYLTPDEAAQLKGVSRTTIYSAISESRLPSTRILKRLTLKRMDVLAWTPMPNKGRTKGTSVHDQTRRKMSQSQKKRWRKLKGL